MTIKPQRFILFAVLLALCASLHIAAGQVNFRVISSQAGVPVGLAEGSPGVFYSISSPEAAFSVTTQGKLSVLATFPNGTSITSPLVSSANGRFYSSTVSQAHVDNVFSVSSAPSSLRTYPALSLDPTFAQNLPNGEILGHAGASTGFEYLVKYSPDGTLTRIYQFPQNYLSWAPILGADGNYYGVASSYVPT